jgi:ABC-type uncharacterized transport system fused permease/ATPase subunit
VLALSIPVLAPSLGSVVFPRIFYGELVPLFPVAWCKYFIPNNNHCQDSNYYVIIKSLNFGIFMQSWSKKTLLIFWQHAWRYKWQVILIVLGILFVEGMQIYIPLVYRDLFNLLAAPKGGQVVSQATKLIVIILALNLLRIVLWRVHNFINNYFQPRVMADLTNTCYQYLQKHSYSFF